MANFLDSDVFVEYLRSPMAPCTAPVVSDFSEDPDTLIFCNIAGEMRLYSFDGVKVQYQVLQLGSLIDSV